MKVRLLVISILVAGLALVLTWAFTVQVAEAKHSDGKALTNGAPHSLNLNLGSDDPTIDPALATDGKSLSVVNQLFLGLVRVDDETGEPTLELATSWEMSSDAQVFTFTLRSDVTWSDDNLVTAHDVRYGILRSLDPDMNAGAAYPLFVIQNAEAYNDGSITDPNQVGITVIDNTHIRFDLNQAAAYLPSIVALPVARAMPAAAIAAHPDDWTEPANIIINGPYSLTAWTHSTSMTLQKNVDYYDAANVQIDQVLFSMVDDTTAWGMYQTNHLDSAIVPQEQWSAAQGDPLLRQELRSAQRLCTYYYGFNTAKEPFDDVQVRKAFIAAVNRQGVIDDATGYAQRPALTFTSPGIFGHVDGAAEGVGVPYNPIHARQWLADAGYPNGQGLPPITLMYNTSPGHHAVAESVRQDWIDNLQVTVILSDTNYTDYRDLLETDPPQVWRMGWCFDYNDAYNFLNDGVNRAYFGNWNNTTYNNLLSQAAQTADSNTRKSLYKQAEEILVETDAVMLPIYYYANGAATRSYLERTYSYGGFGGRIADWRITKESAIIDTGGGDLTSYDGDTNLQLPSGAITATVVMTHTPTTGNPPGGNLNSIGNVFDLTAIYTGTAGLPAQIVPGYHFTITAQYSQTQIGPTVEDTLGLYWWDEGGSHWSQQGISSTVNIIDNLVTAQVDHFSLFAVLGETFRVYIPVVLKIY